ncbi:MAG: hypothetical protein U0796_16075 [Gemmatales bacterium]
MLVTVIALLMTWVVSARDEQVVRQDAKIPNMFPLAKGTQWHSDVNVNGMTISLVQEVTESSKQGNVTKGTVTTKVNGQDINEELSIDEKGIYRHSVSSFKLDKPMLSFKYPIQVQKWTETINLQGMTIDVKLDMKAAEDITVAAGSYKKVIPVEISMNVQGQDIIATNYYAEGVGIIKQEMTVAGNKITAELKKYVPGDK